MKKAKIVKIVFEEGEYGLTRARNLRKAHTIVMVDIITLQAVDIQCVEQSHLIAYLDIKRHSL